MSDQPSAPPPGQPIIDPQELASVVLSHQDGVTVAVIEGEIDISNASTVSGALTALPNLALGLVVDLRATTYLDSAGVSMLHDLTTRLNQRSQRLVLVCDAQSLPRRVLTLTGMDARAAVLADVAEAVALVRDAAATAPEG